MTQLRALIIDDSQAMRRSIIYALQRLGGWTCEESADGADALRRFTERPFDLVITDINMPVLDGLKLLEHIRSHETHSKVPVIVISTEGNDDDKSRAMQAGASAYLAKPIQAKAVVDCVTQLIKLPK